MLKAVRWRHVRLYGSYTVLFIAIVWIVQWEHIPPGSFGARLNRILNGSYFNFVTWESEALLGKFRQELVSPQDYVDEPARKKIVLDYFDLVTQIRRIEGEIARIYADPALTDPEVASEEQRAVLEELRREQARTQGTAEGILEEQISSVLLDEGLGFLGRVIPPVSFHFTPLPTFLVISPRSEISLSRGAMLRGDLALERRDDLESQIDTSLDVSSLIVPIGGLAIYPAMMQETTDLVWAIGATAHEWSHHYYFFWLKPVGRCYDANILCPEPHPDVRTINETAADIIGDAIKAQVLARYYPELLPPPNPTPEPAAPAAPAATPEPPAFDFIAEMRKTRVNADRLLAEGKIEEAETYMELRRRFFVEQGYGIRKLNQAYFAFYGAYASDPGGGAAGDNPVGNPVQELWAASPSIKSFIDALAPITSREMLLDLLAEKGVPFPPPTLGQN